ncbi:MAG: hypothetical protein ACI94Y_001076 [Maribacter sp.]|jgi:hypothetical protein
MSILQVVMINKIINHPFVKSLQKKLSSFKESKNGKIFAKVLKYAFHIGIFAFLIYQLTEIGWMNVLKALPITPWFYLLLLTHYFVLPISEQFIYRLSLNFSFWEGVKIFVKKKILNNDVYVYSGEAYFYWWAKQNLSESGRHIFNVIKDNNIISTIASTLMAVVLLVISAYVIQETNLDIISISWTTVKWVLISTALLLPVIIYLLRYLISMPPKVAAKIFGIHMFRFIATYGLEMLQWMVVIHEIPIEYWFVFLGSKIILNRLPIPSYDLAFIPVSIAISEQLDIDSARITALMIAIPAINRLINILFYSLLTFFEKDLPKNVDEPPIETD